MQRFVDDVLAVSKESVKTLTYEALNNIVRFINGFSALLLTILPGKANILDGVQGWELRPGFRAPRLPRWMEQGVSSFNQFIYELSVDSDTSSLEYSSGDDDFNESSSTSPLSPNSPTPNKATFKGDNWHWTDWLEYLLSWILLPVKFMFRLPLYFLRLFCAIFPRTNTTPKSPRTPRSPFRPSLKKVFSSKDQVVQCATDRRRGVIEDLHLAIEISIEMVFDIFHKISRCIFSPSEAFRIVSGWFSSSSTDSRDEYDEVSEAPVPVDTLGDNDPAPKERNVPLYSSLNTDARTCQDVITELGYPYEAIRVITADGYVLLVERIPRRDARKAVYLQHGVLDSSMGWVSNGVVGSPAFAAFDQGYDVFLGNFRGLVSREHVDNNISSREYWRYSINEHGTQDIPAMIEKIHEVKTAELKIREPEEEISEEQSYKLCAICHSLGGAAILMYVITRRIEEKPHRLSRLVLLSPAGFHDDSTIVFTVVENMFLLVAPIMALFVPAFYIPTRFFRMLLNKLARDFHNYPAVGGLVQTLMSYVVGGDSSNWVGVMGLPHYNMNDMPGVAFRVALHLVQIKRSGRFRMYDYGNARTNREVYGSAQPLDLGEYYELIDVPVDLVAGRKDKVIRPSMVRKHCRVMKDSSVEVSYREFEYAHLDFTFSHHEELLAYVMSRLPLVEPAQKDLVQESSLGTKLSLGGRSLCFLSFALFSSFVLKRAGGRRNIPTTLTRSKCLQVD